MKIERAQELPAHHHPDGGFRNPWPAAPQHGLGSFLKWVLLRERPKPGNPPRVSSAPFEPASPDDQGASITWIGHSTFLIQSRGIGILTDPIWSNRASPVQFVGPHRYVAPPLQISDLPTVDVVVISHDHYDHLDLRSIADLTNRFPLAQWVAPLVVGRFLRDNGVLDVIEMDWWDSADLGSVSVHCTPAQHFSGRKPWNRNSTLWCGWVIGIGSHRVFFAGDTGRHPQFAEIAQRFGPIDAAILPIGAYEPRWFMETVHMSPNDAVSAYVEMITANASRECVFIPSHWGTFRLTDEPLDEPPRLLEQAWVETRLSMSNLCVLVPGDTKRLP
jgi:N-acyl-phosphatidylethanolamine-hydrolysing phospholipase D